MNTYKKDGLMQVLEEKALENGKLNSEEKSSLLESVPKLKALIVDDVPVNRLIACQMLKNAFDCKEAENGEEAVHSFSEEQPDLILMDISMPVMNGVEALKKIRQLNNDNRPIPIIAVTTGGILGNRKELLEEGFSEFIKKPVAQQELFEKIAYFLPHSFNSI